MTKRYHSASKSSASKNRAPSAAKPAGTAGLLAQLTGAPGLPRTSSGRNGAPALKSQQNDLTHVLRRSVAATEAKQTCFLAPTQNEHVHQPKGLSTA